MPSITILAALDLEARSLAAALGLSRVSPMAFARRGGDPGGEGGGGLQLRTIGMGAGSLAGALDGVRPACIVMAGLGGGLDPALRTGDLVLEGCSGEMAAKVAARPGRVHSAGRIIGAPREKAELFGSTGACVVDMETAAARSAADGLGCRFIALRAVCDTADMALGPALAECVDPFGRPRAGPLALNLVRRPALIGDLLRLHAASQVALRSLSGGAVRLVGALGADPDGAGRVCCPATLPVP